MLRIFANLMEEERQDSIRLSLRNPNDASRESYHKSNVFNAFRRKLEDGS
jgi:hypothetical protein